MLLMLLGQYLKILEAMKFGADIAVRHNQLRSKANHHNN